MKRIQRLRKKGFKLQEASRSGFPVKYVGRPTKFGNPFKITSDGWIMCYSTNRNLLDPWILWSATGGFVHKDIVELYEVWLNGDLDKYKYLPKPPDIKELKNFDLACFCPLTKPCHADILIEKINEL